MISLKEDQLPQLVQVLEKQFPNSLMIYFLAKNTVENKRPWPGIVFLVDDFPNVSVCVCRPESPESSVPTLRKSTVFTSSVDSNIFVRCLQAPSIVDWTQNIIFPAITKGEEDAVIDYCSGRGGLGRAFWYPVMAAIGRPQPPKPEDAAPYAVFYHVDLINLPVYRYTMPESLRLGTLEPKHASRLAIEKHYGDTKNNKLYFQYMLDHKFLNVCIYNEKDVPVAYVIQSPQGPPGSGYTNPEYRQMGLFKIVCYELLKKIRDDGETFTFFDIMAQNWHSRKAVESLGAKLYDGFSCAWIEYNPKTSGKSE